MIYKISFSGWKDSLQIGDEVQDVSDVLIKVLSIVKVESYEGDIFIHVQGVRIIDL
jgi:hypothetical protein